MLVANELLQSIRQLCVPRQRKRRAIYDEVALNGGRLTASLPGEQVGLVQVHFGAAARRVGRWGPDEVVLPA